MSAARGHGAEAESMDVGFMLVLWMFAMWCGGLSTLPNNGLTPVRASSSAGRTPTAIHGR